MRPGVPWNVKGIEADAREAAQLAARRAGVSLGEYLTQLILTEGRVPGGHGYAPQQFHPGDGTYGPQPQYQQPLPSLRYPQSIPQPPQYQQPPQQYQPLHPHQPLPHQVGYQQPQQGYPQGGPRDQHMNGAAQQGPDAQIRGSEFALVAHGLRDMADRLENSERRAQTAIATVNQSVAAMQDRIDAAERVKQLADVAFTSAADALAQSARDQASAFESLEATVRQVQKRLVDIESGRSEWPGKDSVGRLETALTQLQKRLGEMESTKADSSQKDQFARLEVTLHQLQKRLSEMETARMEFPHKDAMARLEASIAEVRGGVADSEKRSRDDLTQLAKFMRELGSRVEATERGLAQSSGQTKSLTEGVAARLDALEARSSSMFDEMRGQLTAMDGRLAQASANPKSSVAPEAFTTLQRSVDTLAARFDTISDPASSPFSGPMSAIESTLEALTTKIEEGEKRSAESVSTVSSALKTISTRLDDADKRQEKALQNFTRRLDDSDRKATDSAHVVEDALKALTQRLETSDKKHKEAIGGLRLTVDGLVAKAAADALPVEQPYHRATSTPSALSSIQSFTPPPVHAPEPSMRTPEPPPFATSLAQVLSSSPPPPAFEDELPPKADDGFSVSALETIMSRPLSGPETHDPHSFDPDKFDVDVPEQGAEEPQQRKADDFLTQARRAAQAAAQADAERTTARRPSFAQYAKDETGSRKMGRLVIVTVACIAVVAGIVALLFTLPGGSNDEGINRPDAGDSIGEILNGPEAAPATPPAAVAPAPAPAPAAEFAPPTSPEAAAEGAASVAVPPNGLGAPAPAEAAQPNFTAGTSALPGGAPVDTTTIAALEANATRGDAKSQFVLALRYAEGRGVEKDDAKALSLVTKAAQQGLVVAQYRLGAMYERGIGVTKELPQAKTWYERAAKGGNRKAMHNLAVLFADGVGIGQDFAQAAGWFRQGAEYGLADSQYNFAILLERGMGVEKNLNEAAKWYAIASSQGDTGASERLAALKTTMSPADIAVALDAARKFKPKPLDPTANELPAVNG